MFWRLGLYKYVFFDVQSDTKIRWYCPGQKKRSKLSKKICRKPVGVLSLLKVFWNNSTRTLATIVDKTEAAPLPLPGNLK